MDRSFQDKQGSRPVTFILETPEGKSLPGTYHAKMLYNVTQLQDAQSLEQQMIEASSERAAGVVNP